MDNGFSLSNLSTRALMEELFRRGEVDAICGTARQGVFENTWLLKKCKQDRDHAQEFYTVGTARTFGLYETDTLPQAMDKLMELTHPEQRKN